MKKLSKEDVRGFIGRPYCDIFKEIFTTEIAKKAIANTHPKKSQYRGTASTPLSGAFIWNMTMEGHKYWEDVEEQYFSND